ncbi:MAG TPA: YcaO-like family protein, partial [Polyangia bacterium]|nr:YcaO-like family protein [Polyangia bacterium]
AKHEAHRAQMAAPRRPPLRFADRTGLASTSLHDQVSWACRLVEARGVGPVVAVDLSRPDFPIFVVRTIVPGLEASSEVRGYNPGARARRMSAEVGS